MVKKMNISITELDVGTWIYNFVSPYSDLIFAMFALSIAFIYGHSFEYVFGIFSFLCTILYLLIGSSIFLNLTIASLILVLLIKIAHIYNPAQTT